MITNSIARLLKILAMVILTSVLIVTSLGSPTAHTVHAYNSVLIVNSLSDDETAVTGICVQPGTLCVRNAIATAISSNASTLITFNLSGAIYLHGPLSIQNNLTNPVTIDGSGHSIALDGYNIYQVFRVPVGGVATLNALTIQNGHVANFGGGVYNAGALTITNSTIAANTVDSSGGGLYNVGDLTLINSTISGNSAQDGGGIDNEGTLLLSNSTVFGNYGGAYGGGLFNANIATVSNSTFTKNTASIGGGLINTATLSMLSTLVAGNAANNFPDIDSASAVISTLGNNLVGIGTGSQLINGANADQIGTAAAPIDPMITPLADHGGATWTVALLDNSPALASGDCHGYLFSTPSAPAVSIDQRGGLRKTTLAGCDIGAYEFHPIENIGIYRNGAFYLRLHNTTGVADITVPFTAGTKPYPIVGDWAGNGYDTVGVYDQNSGNFTVCTANDATCANAANQIGFTLGNPGDTPLAGRWYSAAGHVGGGVFRPTNGILYMKYTLSTGFADYSMVMGNPGDVGIAGDWTGKRYDSPGVFRPVGTNFYLSNHVTNGIVFADTVLSYGNPADLPIAGDWVGLGHDGVGMFRTVNGYAYLRNALTTGFSDNAFFYGQAGDIPVAGHWQLAYPPIAPAQHKAPPAILIDKTPTAPQHNVPQPANIGSAPGGNQIGG